MSGKEYIKRRLVVPVKFLFLPNMGLSSSQYIIIKKSIMLV